jgi:hypothetical protein
MLGLLTAFCINVACVKMPKYVRAYRILSGATPFRVKNWLHTGRLTQCAAFWEETASWRALRVPTAFAHFQVPTKIFDHRRSKYFGGSFSEQKNLFLLTCCFHANDCFVCIQAFELMRFPPSRDFLNDKPCHKNSK